MFNGIRKGINAKVCLVTIAIRCTTQVQQFLINSLPTIPQTPFWKTSSHIWTANTRVGHSSCIIYTTYTPKISCMILYHIALHYCTLQNIKLKTSPIFNNCIRGERERSPPLPEIMQSRFPHLGNSQGSAQPVCNGWASPWVNHLLDHGVSLAR